MKKILFLLFAGCAAVGLIVLFGVISFKSNKTKSFSNSGEVITSDKDLPEISEKTPLNERVVVVYRNGGSLASLRLTKNDVDARSVISESVDVLHPADGNTEVLIDRLKSNQYVESVFVDDLVPYSAEPKR